MERCRLYAGRSYYLAQTVPVVGWLSAIASRMAYVLAKGRPKKPHRPPRDVLNWGTYTGNVLHPTQKPVSALKPLIYAFSPLNGLVLDPFAGSATTAVAALECNRRYITIEKDDTYYRAAHRRLGELSAITRR